MTKSNLIPCAVVLVVVSNLSRAFRLPSFKKWYTGEKIHRKLREPLKNNGWKTANCFWEAGTCSLADRNFVSVSSSGVKKSFFSLIPAATMCTYFFCRGGIFGNIRDSTLAMRKILCYSPSCHAVEGSQCWKTQLHQSVKEIHPRSLIGPNQSRGNITHTIL